MHLNLPEVKVLRLETITRSHALAMYKQPISGERASLRALLHIAVLLHRMYAVFGLCCNFFSDQFDLSFIFKSNAE